ncbi:MAG: hypothetical protein KF693_08285 [Nitrospira sp.]|nr:hypothetical protein [Nitrospira sp.]
MLTARKVPSESGVACYQEIAHSRIMGDNAGFIRMLLHQGDRHLLGVHAVGPGATALLYLGQAVLGVDLISLRPSPLTPRAWLNATGSPHWTHSANLHQKKGGTTIDIPGITLIAWIYALRSQSVRSDRYGMLLLEALVKPALVEQKGVSS